MIKDIIYISSVNWDGRTQRMQHLALNLSSYFRILYVNPRPISIDIFRKYLLKRNVEGELKLGSRLEKINNNLFVFTPFLNIPFMSVACSNRSMDYLNSLMIARQIQFAVSRLNMKNTLLWLTSPTQIGLINRMDKTSLCYDCLDNFPYFFRGSTRQKVERCEEYLIRHADIILATTKGLEEKCNRINKETYYVPNAVDNVMFDPTKRGECPLDIKHINHPMIGFIGFIGHWIDLDLIKYVAKMRPKWSIVLVGGSDLDLHNLKNCKNILILGERNHDHLPNYLKAFDLCMIPFKINELTDQVNPVKLYEYCSMGKPTVATDTQELRKYPLICKVSRTYEEFIDNIDDILKDDDKEKARIRMDFAKDNSWAQRALIIKKAVLEIKG